MTHACAPAITLTDSAAHGAATPSRPSTARRWARALQLTAPIVSRPHRIMPLVVEERAHTAPDSPALLSDGESLSYSGLATRARHYSRWAVEHGVGRGTVVALLMPNRPEYLAIWLGVTRVGGVVALLNTNLAGPALAHCIDTAAPAHVIADAALAAGIDDVRDDVAARPRFWIHGGARDGFDRIDDVEQSPGIEAYDIERPAQSERQRVDGVTIDDPALYIYTSGTTGLPKAAVVTHARIMQWSHWFAGLMNVRPDDRLYNCLPLYHSVGGVLAIGAALAGGASVVIRDGFSARAFWSDIVRWDCTLFQYIGELCRYLLHAPADPLERGHRVRLCCGNGLRPDVWTPFKERFRIPGILEFYASTEGNVSLVNVEGEPGSIGRIPAYLAHRFPIALVKYDAGAAAPARDGTGFCVRCGPNEVGEAIGPLLKDSSNIGSRFDGYTDRDESRKKIVRDVFKRGDAWYRTGDLMRQDDRGFFYFVDRIGDTFRWKGENVSTAEVAAALGGSPDVRDVCVYGVEVPGCEGRAGMATIVADRALDLAALRAHLVNRLPGYAHPVFLRIRDELDVTTTFKHVKQTLVREGYDPTVVTDRLYFHDRDRHAFVPLERSLFIQIQNGEIRS
jgi:fatty-acyl-CoA synthase